MLPRLAFLVIAAFWVTMNVLLWRAEFRSGSRLGAAVPAEVVWQKVLTSPDNSSLDVYHRGKKVGFCRWACNVGEGISAGKTASEDTLPEDMVRRLSHYTIDFEGSTAVPGQSNRLGFSLHLRLATNNAWQAVNFRVNLRPYVFSIRSEAAAETVRLQFDDGADVWRQTFRFAEMRDPAKLAQQFGGPLAAGLLRSVALPGLHSRTNLSLGVNWEARQGSMQFGSAKIRAYQLRAGLFDRYEVIVLVSPVGEILRAEFPDGWVLANDALPLR
jgi:hypothetical protein